MMMMTKNEIRAFVMDVISYEMFNGAIIEDMQRATDKIVEKWEEDAQENCDEAFSNGQDNVRESIVPYTYPHEIP